MNKKLVIGICVALITAIAVISGYMKFYGGDAYKDKYGFIHNAETSGKTYDVDENLTRDYALVKLKKEDVINISQHEFINKVSPILEGYKDKLYTTFIFDDGTGIFFPYSSIDYIASYGYVDENGNITDQIGTISISGTNVTYSEIKASLSSKTANVYDYIPVEYYSDDLAACADESGLYIAFTWTAFDDEQAKGIVEDFVKNFRDYELKGMDEFFIVLNRTYGYSVNTRTLTVHRNDNVLEETLNKTGIY